MLQNHQVLYLAVFVLVVAIYARRRVRQRLPDLDWLNVRQGEWFSRQRARIRTVRNAPATVLEAYEKYSKRSKCCILPGLGHDVVLLPVDHAPWLVKHPDSMIDNLAVLRDQLQVDHTFPQKRLATNPTHHETIKGEMTRQVTNLVPDIVDEMAAALQDEWGSNETEWREVLVFETCSRVVSRAINRVLVGESLCRNEQMLQSAQSWTRVMPLYATILFLTPSFLRWMVAPILMYPVTKYVNSFEAVIIPEIRRRQQASDSDAEKAKPNDFLQWTMNRAEESADPRERTAQTMAQRLLLVNFGATHNTAVTMTDTIFELLAAGRAKVEALTEESSAALRETHGEWNKKVLHRLIKHDSAVKESLRLGGVMAANIGREVVASDGVTAPNGTFLPQGTIVALSTWGMHRESQVYDEPEKYRPFRFSDMQSQDLGDSAKDGKLSAASISPEYHPWGLGRHACPGRFFAVHEMKLLLAYMFQTYDFDFSFPPEKPKGTWIGATAVIPPMKATVRIRRKAVKENH